jgi:hypothetical protein
VSGYTSSSESLTRDQDIYTGVARFVVPEAGEYHVRIDGPPGKRVVVAPSIGSGFGAVLGWLFAGLASVVALVVGVVLIIIGAIRRRRRPKVTGPPGYYGNGAPAGWYSAPDAAGRERYWNGGAWTHHVR